MRNILFLLALAFLWGCGGGSDSGAEPENITLLNIDVEPAVLADDYADYSMLVNMSVSTPEDIDASFILCFNQNSDGGSLSAGQHSLSVYNSTYYESTNCSSEMLALTTDTLDYTATFDMYDIIRDKEYKQVLFGKGDLYLISEMAETVYSLGEIELEEIIPWIDIEDINYERVELDFDGGTEEWNITNGTAPQSFVVPLNNELSLHGSGADSIDIGFSDHYIYLTMSDSTVRTIPFSVEDSNFTAQELPFDINYTDDTVVSDSVSVIAVTDSDNPNIHMATVIAIDYSELADMFPDVDSCVLSGVDATEINCPSVFDDIISAEIRDVSISANVKSSDHDITDAFAIDMDITDLLWDIEDLWILTYSTELAYDAPELDDSDIISEESLSRAPRAAPTNQNFYPLRYEANFSKRNDNGMVGAAADFKAGVYTDNKNGNSIVSPYMRAEARGNVNLRFYGENFNMLNASLVTTAKTDDGNTLSLEYLLQIVGKTVVSDKLETAGKLTYNKNISFEKEMNHAETVWIGFLPISYSVGGRGALGIGLPQGISNLMELRTTSETISGITIVGVKGTIAARPYINFDAYATGGVGFNYNYSKKIIFSISLSLALRAGVGFGASAKLVDAGISPALSLTFGVENNGGNNYAVVKIDFKTPMDYTLLNGKVHAYSELYLKAIWELVNLKKSWTIVDIKGPSERGKHLITPINNTWSFKLPPNTP